MVDTQKIIIILILVCVILLVLRLNGEFFQIEQSIRSDNILSMNIDENDTELNMTNSIDESEGNDLGFDTISGRVRVSNAYFTN